MTALDLRCSAAAAAALALTLTLFSAGCAPSRAGDKEPPAASSSTAVVEPKARAAVDRMRAAYRGMTSYSGTIEVAATESFALPSVKAKLRFQRPNRISVVTTERSGTARAVCDGKTLYAVVPDEPKKYLKRPAPAGSQALVTALMESGATGPGLTAILAGADPIRQFQRSLKSVRFGEESRIAGTPVETVTIDVEGPQLQATLTLFIGKNDHLLRRAQFAQKVGSQVLTVTENHSDIRRNPVLPASAFLFTPPRGAKPVVSFGPLPYDESLQPGARPFPIQANDLAGKPLTLSQYKGKVVLLDFWATWCGPCVQELPNVAAPYKTYRGRGFEIVGISLDRPGQQPALAAFVRENKISWRQIYDEKGSLARRYGVQAIPFTLLIGRDGRIAAVNPRGAAALDEAVRSALAGK